MSKELTLTSFDDLLGDYKEGTVELSTGKVFSIQNFSPGNLLIEIGSPLVDMMTEASETGFASASARCSGYDFISGLDAI